ncbi:hypothetical protein HDU98_004905 [Podochytrium sp. JEL0797]|nr:hypothetical protein HDU98_004905 [Podochytrium sp. JEL0797]
MPPKVPGTGDYTAFEDLAIARAWITASQDATVGSNQTGTAFEEKILASFKMLMPGTTLRDNPSAMKQRFTRLNANASKYAGVYQFIHDVEHSGWTDEDYEKAVVEAWEAETFAKKLTYMRAKPVWEVLKELPKWIRQFGPKPASNASAAPSAALGNAHDSENESELPPSTPPSRPTGTKAAKRALQEAHSESKKVNALQALADSHLSLAVSQQKMVELAKERNILNQEQNDLKYFSSELENGLNEQGKRYLEMTCCAK